MRGVWGASLDEMDAWPGKEWVSRLIGAVRAEMMRGAFWGLGVVGALGRVWPRGKKSTDD